MHYFPIGSGFLALLAVVFVVLVVLVELGVFSYAYQKMGVGRHYVFAILLMTLLGSAINIPIASLPANDIEARHSVDFLGVHYVVPAVEHQGRTILAVNLGGAVIPVCLSLYLLVKNRLYFAGPVAIILVALVAHLVAQPVHRVGIAMPPLVPPIAAAVVALVISRRHAAPLAYMAGSVGTLLGADILNLDRIQQLGAPIASIGGAGISDGVFLSGVIAVLLA
jgi:uncharacterized membrane protein